MRAACLLAVVLTGCTDGVAPPSLDASANVDEGDNSEGGVVSDGGGRDLRPIVCQTACDCPSGQRCRNSACEVVVPEVFCCGTAACTGDSLCQQSNGEVSQCSLPPDAGVRPAADSGTQPCASTACVQGATGNILCELACGKATSTCVNNQGGSGAHCMP